MLIALIGESCTGKSTLAQELCRRFGSEVITGKDYLRLAKSPSEAEALFRRRLEAAVTGEPLIYVISEPEHLELLPQGALRILVTASLASIQARFRNRMGGTLPPPVAQMLERKHGVFDNGDYALRYNSDTEDVQAVCQRLAEMLA